MSSNDLTDVLGSAPAKERKKRNTYYTRKDHGPLHQLIGRALPYLRGPDGVANLHSLAAEMELTYAACHKWVRPGQPQKLPPKRAEQIVALSEKFARSKKAPEDFTPVAKADFLPFLI